MLRLLPSLQLALALWLTFICSNTAQAATDEPIVAQLVWVESAAKNHQIFIADLRGEDWSEPYAVYQSENELASPVLATDLSGGKWLVWSERSRKKLVLMSQHRPVNSSTWEPARIVSDLGYENTGPAVAVDLVGQLWLVWAANPGGMDDVYFSVREPGSSWTEPARLNEKNEVPDIRPAIELLKDGDVQVSWQTFDFNLGGYTVALKQFALDSLVKTRYKTPLDPASDLRPEDVALPNFVPGHTVVSLHLPKNRLVQSVRLN